MYAVRVRSGFIVRIGFIRWGTICGLPHVEAKVDEIPGANGNKLKQGKDDAYHSQYLARIITDVPLEVALSDTKLTGFDFDLVRPWEVCPANCGEIDTRLHGVRRVPGDI